MDSFKLTPVWRHPKMEEFKRYQKYQRVVSDVDTEWLIDCAITPSDNMRQAEIDIILLEITQRIWNGQDACPSNNLL